MTAEWASSRPGGPPRSFAPLPDPEVQAGEAHALPVQAQTVGHAWTDGSHADPLRDTARSKDGRTRSKDSRGSSETQRSLFRKPRVSKMTCKLLQLPEEAEENLKAGMGRPWTSMVLFVLILVILICAAVSTWESPLERCDSGPTFAPRFSGDGNQFREQVTLEIAFSFLASVALGCCACLYLRRLAVESLSFYTHATGVHLLLSFVNFGLYCWFVGLQSCQGGNARGSSAFRVILIWIGLFCDFFAWLQLQLCICWKAQAVHEGHQINLKNHLLHTVALYLPMYVFFGAYYVAEDPSVALTVFTFVTFILFVGKFALFTFLAARQLYRARQLLASTEVDIPNKGVLVDILTQHTVAAVTANSTTVLLYIARVSARSMNTLAVEFVIRYLDLFNNTLTVLLLTSMWRACPETVDAVINVVAVWRRLAEARNRIISVLGYDIQPQMQPLARAAWISQEAYTEVLNQVKAREGSTVADLLDMESQYLYDMGPDNKLLPERMVEPGKQAEELLQTATSIEQLREEAQRVQYALKDRMAPGTEWARTGPAPAKLIRRAGSSSFHPSSIDGCYDPGVKSVERIEQKTEQKYAGNFRRVRDAARLALHFDTAAGLLRALPDMMSMFNVVQIENRFAEPTALGWADVTVLVSMPVARANAMTIHYAEIQLQLTSYYEARVENHKHYKMIRSALPELGVRPEHMDLVQSMILDALDR